MKTLHLAAAAWLVAAGATAQTATAQPTTQSDVHVVIGWQNLHKDQPQDHYDDWLNAILYAGAGAGWYWNDHSKTQVDVGAGTRAQQYRFRQFDVNGSPAFESSRVSVRQDSVAVAQQYQFFRNQWFHPHVGGGVEIARETSTEEYQPVTVFDNVARVSRQISPARTEGPTHRFIARPFLQTGFKAYMTRRAFFTSDARMMVRGGIDEVLLRFGFGVDF
jgi:opacity protein-like surface antigen